MLNMHPHLLVEQTTNYKYKLQVPKIILITKNGLLHSTHIVIFASINSVHMNIIFMIYLQYSSHYIYEQ